MTSIVANVSSIVRELPQMSKDSVGDLAKILNDMSGLQMFISCVAFFIMTYFSLNLLLPSSLSKRDRRKSWIVTMAASGVMSITGLYFACRLYESNGTILIPDVRAFGSTSPEEYLTDTDVDQTMAKAISIFFLAYCVVDFVFCIFVYPHQVSIGLSHHTGYAVLLVYLLRSRQSLLFAVCAIEELPTFILSLYELNGDTRPRLSTGMAIFALRVSYHLYITYKASELLNLPLFFFSTYLLLYHIGWFRQWFLKRIEAIKPENNTLQSSSSSEQPSVAAAVADDESAVKKHHRKLAYGVETHVYFVATILCVQALMHLVLVFFEVREFFHWKKDWPERTTASATLLFDLVVHTLIFLLVAARMVGIVKDVYTEGFIMHTINKDNIIYNISWEDPRVERELLQIGKGDVILTISSAGCNVLDYLVKEPENIVACDFNAAQLAVLELKLACIEHLNYQQYWEIWSESNYDTFTAVYQSVLRPKVIASKTPTSASTIRFWDENGDLIKNNFAFAGSSGLAARMLHPALKFLGIVDNMVSRKAYPPASVGLALLLHGILKNPFVWAILAPLGGVPESQLALISREPQVWSERLEEVIGRRMWGETNYFYYYYVVGKWSKECCPPYMQEKNFAVLKAGAKRRAVTMVHGGWADGAQLRKDFTVASLLDSMDWMPDSMIADNIARLYPQLSDGSKKSKPCKIFWRSFATKVHSPVLAALEPDLVPDPMDGSERVGWYLSQWVATVEPGKNFSNMLCKGSDATFKNTPAQDLKVLATMASHALRSEKDSVEFYRSQGDAYDGFRETLLPDRDMLQLYCLPWQTAPTNWVSVGCGTARDVEYVVGHLKTCKTHLYLLDLSPALLTIAKERVERLGLEKQVTLVEANVLEVFDSKGKVNAKVCKYLLPGSKPLPNLGEVDMVTCSYCLTMIPPWKAALEVMVSMLKEGGSLSIIDFTKREDRPTSMYQNLIAWWFSNDGVYLNDEHVRVLKSHKALKTVWHHESESRVPYMPLNATHYVWTGKKVAVVSKK